MEAADAAFGGGNASTSESTAAAAAAAVQAEASALGASLGLSDLSLDDGKVEGMAISALQEGTRSRKRAKLTHSTFFDDDRGLNKVLKTFPKIKFHGKGREYEDVSLLLAHYSKWFQELHPFGDHFEDLVLKARQVLEDKEKEDDGTISDPRERLHVFRLQYKSSAGQGAKKDAGSILSDEQRAKIEANRKRAMERKRLREGGEEVPAQPAASTASQEVDPEDLWRMEEERMAAERLQGAPFSGFDNPEEDPFGGGFDDPFGGGFDDPFGGGSLGRGGSAAAAVKASAAPPAFDEEEDVFGYGGGFDEEFASKPAAPPPAKPKMDPEVERRIAENRAKALARKAAAAATATASAAPATTASDGVAVVPETSSQVNEKAGDRGEALDASAANASTFHEEDDIFACSGGFDDP